MAALAYKTSITEIYKGKAEWTLITAAFPMPLYYWQVYCLLLQARIITLLKGFLLKNLQHKPSMTKYMRKVPRIALSKPA